MFEIVFKIWYVFGVVFTDCAYRWSFLDVRDTRHNTGINDDYHDMQMAGIAGFLEGNLTASLIEMHWQNTLTGYCDDKEEYYCNRLNLFIDNNLDYCAKLFLDSDTRKLQ